MYKKESMDFVIINSNLRNTLNNLIIGYGTYFDFENKPEFVE